MKPWAKKWGQPLDAEKDKEMDFLQKLSLANIFVLVNWEPFQTLTVRLWDNKFVLLSY